MEDGHFDASGNFIFNKKEKEIKDAWLDDIDWTKVKEKAGKDWQGEQVTSIRLGFVVYPRSHLDSLKIV